MAMRRTRRKKMRRITELSKKKIFYDELLYANVRAQRKKQSSILINVLYFLWR